MECNGEVVRAWTTTAEVEKSLGRYGIWRQYYR
jgi:hypothetical protein